MNTTYQIIKNALIIVLCTFIAQAQSIDDGVRFIDNPGSVGARSAAMGNAFIGVANDYSAVYWNPAGLSFIRRPEFSFGISNLSASNDATYLGSSLNQTNGVTVLNNIGFVLPFPVVRGSLVFAVGYNRVNNFNYARSFSGFNTQSSVIPTLYDPDPDFDAAWQLGLEDTTSIAGNKNIFQIKNNIDQEGDVIASGSLNQFALSGSLEVQRNLSIGFTFGIITGSYRREKTITERDSKNLYQGIIPGKDIDRTDFQSMSISETIEQDLSGWNSTIALMYDHEDKFRAGFTIKTPSFISIKEDYFYDGTSRFANASETWNSRTFNNDYSVTTPWIFSIGVSGKPVEFVTLAGDVDFVDNKSLNFSDGVTVDAERHLRDLNKEIKDSKVGLRSTMNYRFGTEVTIPQTGVQLRAGYSNHQSPYVEDKGKTDYDSKTISFGIGYLLENSFLINATYAMNSYSAFHYSYYPDSEALLNSLRTDEKIDDSTIAFSIAFRF